METAVKSMGSCEGLVSGEIELKILFKEMQQYEKCMALIESLALEIPDFDKLLPPGYN